jgi:hypothetical protein
MSLYEDATVAPAWLTDQFSTLCKIKYKAMPAAVSGFKTEGAKHGRTSRGSVRMGDDEQIHNHRGKLSKTDQILFPSRFNMDKALV